MKTEQRDQIIEAEAKAHRGYQDEMIHRIDRALEAIEDAASYAAIAAKRWDDVPPLVEAMQILRKAKPPARIPSPPLPGDGTPRR